ncbi:hypothetical protein AURDEDRAFT_116611 [Auricularia subglabra TFB-10046 SS5]|nr:hypothetical protein AURDEDRAFT_116611 [Auricularia subglabra TFB-10046 SS5]
MPVVAHAEVVQFTWVESCLEHGRRLPYTYSSDPQAHVAPVDTRETPRTNRSATSPTIAGTEDSIGRFSTFEHGPSSREAGILPLPCPSILRFNAFEGRIHPPELKAYFESFLTAMWTLDPSRSIRFIKQDLVKILPNLSVWSLNTFAKRQKQRVRDAMENGLAAHRSGVAAGATVVGEMKKLLDALTAIEPGWSRKNGSVRTTAASGDQALPTRQRPTYSPLRWGHHRLGLDTLIGDTTVRALLEAPNVPALPTDRKFESKYAFYDEVLQWVLEREPTAARFSINSFVYELGGREMFTERSFESSYKGPARMARYKQIRSAVLKKWRSGELGTLSAADEAIIANIDRLHERHKSPVTLRASSSTQRVRYGATTTRSRARLSRLGGLGGTPVTTGPFVASSTERHQGSTAYSTPGTEKVDAGAGVYGGNATFIILSDDEDEVYEEDFQDDVDGFDGADGPMNDDVDELEDDVDELEDDVSEHAGGDMDIDDDRTAPTAVLERCDGSESAESEPLVVEQEPANTLFPEEDEEKILIELAKCVRWYEDYVLQKHDAATRATKRASIWQHMVIKFKSGTNDDWRAFYLAKEEDVMRRVQELRARPAGK